MSGITTAPLIIRKVDKGKISMEDGGPVSQMQKIALQRVNPDGTRHYLSAAGPVPGTPGAIVAPPAPGMASQAGTHHLLFQAPRLREEVKDGVRTVTDEVDDYLCWTIVGICEHLYFAHLFGPIRRILILFCLSLLLILQRSSSIHSSMHWARIIRYRRCRLRHSRRSLQLRVIGRRTIR